jgi:hypothetical protein
MRFFALLTLVAPCVVNSFSGFCFQNINSRQFLAISQKIIEGIERDGCRSLVINYRIPQKKSGPRMCLNSPDPAKRQAYQDVALRGLVDVGQRVPQEWSEGIEFEFSEMSSFQANEIVVLKRPDGSLRFGRIELTSSATLFDDDTVELGRGGNSARSIHVVEIERGLMGSRQYRSNTYPTTHIQHTRKSGCLLRDSTIISPALLA